MRVPRRGPKLPESVRAVIAGRVLAATQADDDRWLVGTRDQLHVVGEEHVTLGWEEVHRADWDGDTSTLRVERVEEFGRPVTGWSFVIPEPGPLLPLLRERVSASIVLQRRVELGRKRGFSVIGRRAPSGGQVSWAFELDRGVDPDDPAVREAADAALRQAQESLGLH